MASTVADTHRFLEEKDGFIRKNLMSSDRCEDLLDSFSAVGLKPTDEQYNELLSFRVIDDFQDFCISDEFEPILAGSRCKRELSDTGNKIPNENINPADMDQAQGEIDNNAAADNNAQNENGNEDEGNANDTVSGQDSCGDGDGGDGDDGDGDDGDDGDGVDGDGGDGDGGDAGDGDDGDGGGANEGNANGAVAGEDSSVDGDSGDDGGEDRRLVIYRYELKGDMRIDLMEPFFPEVIAEDYQSWDDLAQDILTEWREVAPGRMNYVVNNVTPANCWPRAETIFGCFANGLFQSLNWRSFNNFVDVRRYIDTLLVIENMNGFADNGVAHAVNDVINNDIIGDGQISTYLYRFDHDYIGINLAEQFNVSSVNGAAFGSWDDVARELLRRYQLRFGIEPIEMAVNAATCWPGADTIFGRREHGRFQSLNWPSYDWEEVRQRLNCLLLIVYQ